MLRQIDWGVQNGSKRITKNIVLLLTTLFHRKFCFSLKTWYKKLIWCTSYPNIYINTFRKRWNFIWGCFSLWVSLNRLLFFLKCSDLRIKTSRFLISFNYFCIVQAVFLSEYIFLNFFTLPKTFLQTPRKEFTTSIKNYQKQPPKGPKACNFIKIETPTLVFSCEFYKNFNIIFFHEKCLENVFSRFVCT